MLNMTDEQKYSAVLKELGELLQSKNTTIACQQWQIDNLKEKLAAAEKERDEMCEEANDTENALGDGKTYWLLDSEALQTIRQVNATLRACYNNIAINAVEDKDIQNIAQAQRMLADILPIKGGAA